jgi:hypothetical protein
MVLNAQQMCKIDGMQCIDVNGGFYIGSWRSVRISVHGIVHKNYGLTVIGFGLQVRQKTKRCSCRKTLVHVEGQL